jgi:hypothetical protein
MCNAANTVFGNIEVDVYVPYCGFAMGETVYRVTDCVGELYSTIYYEHLVNWFADRHLAIPTIKH